MHKSLSSSTVKTRNPDKFSVERHVYIYNQSMPFSHRLVVLKSAVVNMVNSSKTQGNAVSAGINLHLGLKNNKLTICLTKFDNFQDSSSINQL